jgi:hypothetical protein
MSYILEDDNEVFRQCSEFLRRMGRSFKSIEEFARYAEAEGWPGQQSILSIATERDAGHSEK